MINNLSELADGELDANLAIQEGIIESCKGDTIRRSKEFMKALEIKISIEQETARRQSKNSAR